MPRKGARSKSEVKRVPITEARSRVGAIVKSLRRGEYVVLEKDGVPVAGMMDIEEFEDYLEVQDPKIQAYIRKSRAEHRSGKSFPAENLVPELEHVAQSVSIRQARLKA